MTPVVNIDSVLDKVYEWEKSKQGSEKIQKVVNKYKRSNVKKTDAGSRVITNRDMKAASDKLVKTIKSTARGCSLPQSVLEHFDSLRAGRPQLQPDGSFLIEINFTDDLSRESLEPHRYGGVQNIIAIFNNGYPLDESRAEAISHVSGWWHGKYTNALGSRQGLYFIQDAVNDFNLNYGIPLGMVAEVGAIYDYE